LRMRMASRRVWPLLRACWCSWRARGSQRSWIIAARWMAAFRRRLPPRLRRCLTGRPPASPELAGLSAYDLICRFRYDLTCRSRRG